jgi:hypothetical protein
MVLLSQPFSSGGLLALGVTDMDRWESLAASNQLLVLWRELAFPVVAEPE